MPVKSVVHCSEVSVVTHPWLLSFPSLLATTALPSASALQARNLSQVGLLRLLHSIHSYANIASFKGNRGRSWCTNKYQRWRTFALYQKISFITTRAELRYWGKGGTQKFDFSGALCDQNSGPTGWWEQLSDMMVAKHYGHKMLLQNQNKRIGLIFGLSHFL